MKDYRELSVVEKAKVDKMILETVESGHHRNEHTGFEWDEPQWTLKSVHDGYYCAECLVSFYNCLCSHDD